MCVCWCVLAIRTTYNLLILVHCHMNRQTAGEGGTRGQDCGQCWLAGEQTIYMAQLSSAADSASDRHSLGGLVLPFFPLSVLLFFCRWTSWEFRFDIRNLFENFIAFHALTIVFVYKKRFCRLLLVLFMLLLLCPAGVECHRLGSPSPFPCHFWGALCCILWSAFIFCAAFFAMFWHF